MKLTLSTSIIGLTLLSSMAIAQNTKAPTDINWTGFYAGLNIGGVFNNVKLHSNHFGFTVPTETCDIHSNFDSFFPGAQLGYLRQLESNVVLGVEGDFTYNVNPTGNLACTCPFTPTVSDSFTIKNRSQGSIRGRLGYLVKPQLLPFIAAGGSFANLGMAYSNEGGDYYSTSKTQAGWLLGGGLEWAFAPSWSLRAEYDYIDYGSMNMGISSVYGLYDPNGGAHANLSSNNVKLAVNHWF